MSNWSIVSTYVGETPIIETKTFLERFIEFNVDSFNYLIHGDSGMTALEGLLSTIAIGTYSAFVFAVVVVMVMFFNKIFTSTRTRSDEGGRK